MKLILRKKINSACFFVKYFDKVPTSEEIHVIEAVLLLNYFDEFSIKKAYKYIIEKKKVFNSLFEFTTKEKLFISLNIYLNLYKNIDAKLQRYYDLPKQFLIFFLKYYIKI